MKREPDRRSGFDSAAPAAGAGPSSPALDWVVPTGAVDRVKAAVNRRLQQRRRRLVAMGVGLVVMGLATVSWHDHRAGRVAEVLPASAIVLSPARQVLPDGSIAELNGDADLVVEFSDTLRRVTLRRGEAYFEVAKNAARPFVVSAGGVDVRAVGTQFSVAARPDAVDVLVTEGRIAVENNGITPASAAGPDAARFAVLVDAGQRARVPLADDARPLAVPQVQDVAGSGIDAQLAWRIPRVEFSRTPLVEVATIFRRYAGVRITFSESAMAGLELSGVLRADNVDSLLQVLEAEFRIRAERRGSDILLRR